MARAFREVKAITSDRGYVEASGRKKGDATPRLETVTVRIIPEDEAELQRIARESARSVSFLARVALHMFVEAHRRNPHILRADQ